MLEWEGKLLRLQTSLPRLELFVLSCKTRVEDEAFGYLDSKGKLERSKEMKTRDRPSTRELITGLLGVTGLEFGSPNPSQPPLSH